MQNKWDLIKHWRIFLGFSFCMFVVMPIFFKTRAKFWDLTNFSHGQLYKTFLQPISFLLIREIEQISKTISSQLIFARPQKKREWQKPRSMHEGPQKVTSAKSASKCIEAERENRKSLLNAGKCAWWLLGSFARGCEESVGWRSDLSQLPSLSRSFPASHMVRGRNGTRLLRWARAKWHIQEESAYENFAK